MRNTLLLRKDSAGGDTWHWLGLDNEGRPQSGVRTGALADAAAETGGRRVVILAPGEECLLTRVKIPGRSRAKLLRAVPFALEEQVSEDVENLHFAVADSPVDGEWPVAIISHHYIESLLEAIAAVGLDVQQVVPEILAIPHVESETSVLIEGDVALVRTGSWSGYAVDSENVGMLLSLQGSDDTDPPGLHLFTKHDIPTPEIEGYQAQVREESFTGDALVVYAQGLGTTTINLLQGLYSRTGDWMRLLRPWRATAALLLVGVLVSNVATGIDYARLDRESDQLTAQIEQSFRQAIPEIKRIVNPRIQMQQQLDTLQRRQGGAGGFLGLLGYSGTVLKDVQGVEISGATFRAGRLDLDLVVANLQLLDQLKQDLMKSGKLSVEIQSASTGKDRKVQSRIRITGVRS